MDFYRRASIVCLVSLAALALVAPLAFAAGPFSQNHQMWDEGPDILALQQFLNTHGFPLVSTEWGSPGNETDTFGLHTYAALVKFQAANDLPATGYFGPLTRAKIAALTSSTGSSISGGSSTAATSPPATSSEATPTTTSQYIPGVTPLAGYAPGQIIFIGGGPAPDTTPPSVSLTAPTSGSTVAGTVTLSATASDNVAVQSVQFKVDGTNIGSAITSSPYTTTWNSTGVADGSHMLYAVAEDTVGNYATSSISITVENTAVSISSIATSSVNNANATITWTTNEAATSRRLSMAPRAATAPRRVAQVSSLPTASPSPASRPPPPTTSRLCQPMPRVTPRPQATRHSRRKRGCLA
jgi:hypothetical protein